MSDLHEGAKPEGPDPEAEKTRAYGDDPRDAARCKDREEEAFREFLRLYGKLSRDGMCPGTTDAISQALLTVLGSGPPFAVLGSMFAANQANGLMYYNAVSHQQKTNLLSMAMTAKCVRYMLDMRTDAAEQDLEDVIEQAIQNE
jgi:hypothetical protein